MKKLLSISIFFITNLFAGDKLIVLAGEVKQFHDYPHTHTGQFSDEGIDKFDSLFLIESNQFEIKKPEDKELINNVFEIYQRNNILLLVPKSKISKINTSGFVKFQENQKVESGSSLAAAAKEFIKNNSNWFIQLDFFRKCYLTNKELEEATKNLKCFSRFLIHDFKNQAFNYFKEAKIKNQLKRIAPVTEEKINVYNAPGIIEVPAILGCLAFITYKTGKALNTYIAKPLLKKAFSR